MPFRIRRPLFDIPSTRAQDQCTSQQFWTSGEARTAMDRMRSSSPEGSPVLEAQDIGNPTYVCSGTPSLKLNFGFSSAMTFYVGLHTCESQDDSTTKVEFSFSLDQGVEIHLPCA